MNDAEMDVRIEQARCLHRVVRALHDGHCPNCAAIFPADDAARNGMIEGGGESCPKCGFSISSEEAESALQQFAPVMKKSLAVFEQWRADRNQTLPQHHADAT